MSPNTIVILGPTASGKTRLAAHLAFALKGAVLSFDSRQVYKELTIGAGKDWGEFTVENTTVPSYLIDLCNLNQNFHSYDFVKEYIVRFKDCNEKGVLPILCGGTGLYFDLVLKKHQFINIAQNELLRKEIAVLPISSLIEKLHSFPSEFTQQADTSTQKRLVRAIEIATFLSNNTHEMIPYPEIRPLIFGISLSPSERKIKINHRLGERLKSGLIEEVQHLLDSGISKERLIYLGLEYKYITEYLCGEHDRKSMTALLATAIQQYAKRQMTWFRKMEREGNTIHWIDGKLSLDDQLTRITSILKTEKP